MANYKARGASQYTVKTSADLSVASSETLVNTELITKELKVGFSYYIHILGHLKSASSTPNAKFSLDLINVVYVTGLYGQSANSVTNTLTTEDSESLSAGVSEIIPFHIHVMDVTTAGTLRLKFAQGTSNATATIFMKGSTMHVIEI